MDPHIHGNEHNSDNTVLQRDMIARVGLQMDQDTHGIEHDIGIPRDMIVRLGLQIWARRLMKLSMIQLFRGT
jgi:hypothetical protein